MDDLVVLTGAASGIGRATAATFGAMGKTCLLVDRDADGLAAMAGPGRHLLAVDLTETDSFAQIAAAVRGIGRVAALVNNAGMSDPSGVPLADQTAAQGARLMALNLDAPARMFRALRPLMSPGARVVNVASGAGLRAIPFRGAYSPTKAGLIAQSRALAQAEPDLTVTTLCPGFVRTELVDGLIAAGRLDPAQAISKVPMGRMAVPQEMADALVFLASTDARALGGAMISLDGGTSVYGGSIAFSQGVAPLPATAKTGFTVIGAADLAARLPAARQEDEYSAVIDARPLQAHNLYEGVRSAAAEFVRDGERHASLTLLLPPEPEDWLAAGDYAAARMAVATLACEWGPSGLRINALATKDHSSRAVAAAIGWVAGAQAQYLTGQYLQLHG